MIKKIFKFLPLNLFNMFCGTPKITKLPGPPKRVTYDFEKQADAFLYALPELVKEINKHSK